MTRPAGCSVCHADYLTWWHGRPVGPGWPTEASASPMCWFHDSVRMQSNGGLPVARIEQRPLDLLLATFARREEREALRLRGVRYSVRLGATVRELTV